MLYIFQEEMRRHVHWRVATASLIVLAAPTSLDAAQTVRQQVVLQQPKSDSSSNIYAKNQSDKQANKRSQSRMNARGGKVSPKGNSTKVDGHTIKLRSLSVAGGRVNVRLRPGASLDKSAKHCILKLPAQTKPKRNRARAVSDLLGCLHAHGHPHSKSQVVRLAGGETAILLTPGAVMRIQRTPESNPQVRVSGNGLSSAYDSSASLPFDAKLNKPHQLSMLLHDSAAPAKDGGVETDRGWALKLGKNLSTMSGNKAPDGEPTPGNEEIMRTEPNGHTFTLRSLFVAGRHTNVRLPKDNSLHESAKRCILDLPTDTKPERSRASADADLLVCLNAHGHPYGKSQPMALADGKTDILLTPGPVMHIKRIRTSDPQVRISEDRLWSIYGTPPDPLFDAKRVLRFKDALEKNQLLTSISIQAKPLDEKTLELIVDGTPTGQNVIAAGVDYSADGLGVTGRWIHGGPDWLAGKIDSAVRYRPMKNELFARMRIPLSETVEHSARSDLYAEHRKHPAYTVNNRAAMLRLTKPLTEKGLQGKAARYTLGFGLQTGHETAALSATNSRPTDALLSEFRIEGSDYFIPLRTHLTMQVDTVAKWSLSGDSTDRLISIFRVDSETPIPRRWTYAMRLQLSTLHHSSDAPPLLSDRLYLGGGSDMRGYKLGAIGSTIGASQTPGGLTSWTLSPHLLRDVTTPWGVMQLGPFIDVGGISQTHDLSGPIFRSAGLAARTKTQLGNLDISIGQPIDGTNGGPRIYATMGQPF